jgi:hypothetical protein
MVFILSEIFSDFPLFASFWGAKAVELRIAVFILNL